MSWLVDNWYLCVAAIAACVMAIFAGIKFFKMPTVDQINMIKEWLKWAVTEAEKVLGDKTGALKLRYVYDLFIAKFPAFAKVITFETFSGYVDEALEWLRKQLESNKKVSNYVNNITE